MRFRTVPVVLVVERVEEENQEPPSGS